MRCRVCSVWIVLVVEVEVVVVDGGAKKETPKSCNLHFPLSLPICVPTHTTA